jgi:hypothetical protein
VVINILEKHAGQIELEIKFLENKLEHRIVHIQEQQYKDVVVSKYWIEQGQ